MSHSTFKQSQLCLIFQSPWAFIAISYSCIFSTSNAYFYLVLLHIQKFSWAVEERQRKKRYWQKECLYLILSWYGSLWLDAARWLQVTGRTVGFMDSLIVKKNKINKGICGVLNCTHISLSIIQCKNAKRNEILQKWKTFWVWRYWWYEEHNRFENSCVTHHELQG